MEYPLDKQGKHNKTDKIRGLNDKQGCNSDKTGVHRAKIYTS